MTDLDTELHTKNFTVVELVDLFEVSEDRIRGILSAPRNTVEVGKLFNISRQRIYQIEEKALQKLRMIAKRRRIKIVRQEHYKEIVACARSTLGTCGMKTRRLAKPLPAHMRGIDTLLGFKH